MYITQISSAIRVSTCINYHRLSYCHRVPWPFTDTIHVYYSNIMSYQGINMYQLSSTILLSYSALALYRYHPCILPKYHQLSGYQHVSTIIDYPIVIECLGPLPIPSMYTTQISSAIRVSISWESNNTNVWSC